MHLGTVKFDNVTTFLGRNGTFKCTGVTTGDLGDTTFLQPITSRGIIGRCAIEIPNKRLVAVAQLLLPEGYKVVDACGNAVKRQIDKDTRLR